MVANLPLGDEILIVCLFFPLQYYSGEAVAPILTVFIGGNHEASNHMRELYAKCMCVRIYMYSNYGN